jgi:hypothetical protein
LILYITIPRFDLSYKRMICSCILLPLFLGGDELLSCGHTQYPSISSSTTVAIV